MSYFPGFSQRLNEMLGTADRSPAWLARRLDVNPSTVNRWLNHGTRPGDPETVVRIADILGASAERQALLVAAGYGYVEEPEHHAESADLNRSGSPVDTVEPSQPVDRKAQGELANNLPVQATSYIGRREELRQLNEWLDGPTVRLASILGPGGMGKTRLALAAAEAQLQRDCFVDGIFFVALATVTTREDMVTTIADTLGLSAAGSDPETAVMGQLAERQLLLVLDNFEQLLPAAGFLEQLLTMARQVTLLVTTRERLNLPAEWVLDLHGLAYPREEASGDLTRFDAVQLFVERASQVRSPFAPAPEEIEEIANICRLVQGMPLGIELAAGWTRVMALAEIVREIRQNLDFFATSMRNIPDRHRSLRAVFRHSWKMLTAEEQRIFAQLSVFRGGFSREAAKEIAAISLPGLAALVDKSLVRHTPAGRYEIHELLRQFGAEMLAEDPKQEAQTQQAHARFYCEFVAQRETALHRGDQLAALTAIRNEQENIRAAWYTALDQRQFQLIDLALPGWFNFCEMGGYPLQGAQAFDRARQLDDASAGQPASLSPERYQFMRARLLCRQGQLKTRTGNSHAIAITLFEHALDLLLELEQRAPFDVRGELAYAHNCLGLHIYFIGDTARSVAEIREALRIAEGIEEPVEIARAWSYLGHVAEFQGRFTEAAAFFTRSIEFYNSVGELSRCAYAVNNKGRACYGLGNYAEAAALVNQAMAIRTDFNDLIGISYSYLDLGRIAECQGDYAEAERLMQKSLAITHTIATRDTTTRCLIGLGDVALLKGDPQAAQVYFQDAHELTVSIGVRRSIPVCLLGFGRAAHQLQDFDRAASLLEESRQSSHSLGVVGDEARAMLALADLAFDQGQLNISARYLRDCLTIAQETGAGPLALDALLLGAKLVGEHDDIHMPATDQIPLMVAHHPACWGHTRQRARQLLDEETARRQAGKQEIWPVADAMIGVLERFAAL